MCAWMEQDQPYVHLRGFGPATELRMHALCHCLRRLVDEGVLQRRLEVRGKSRLNP